MWRRLLPEGSQSEGSVGGCGTPGVSVHLQRGFPTTELKIVLRMVRYLSDGNQTENTLPSPGVLSTVMRPPWASTISLVIASPNPVPP